MSMLMQDGFMAWSPAGWRRFADANPVLCGQCDISVGTQITLDATTEAKISSIHRLVNGSILYTRDNPNRDEWARPTSGFGDCEDIAIEKLHRLLDAGLPRPAMRFATCFLPGGEYHCVLSMDTDQGTLILCNTQPQVETWERLWFYEWFMRERVGPVDAPPGREWVKIADPHPQRPSFDDE